MISRVKMKKRPVFQKGMTMTEICFLLCGIGFAVICLLAVIPKYIDDGTVTSALESIHQDFSGKSPTNAEVRGKLQKYFQINTVSDQVMKELKITREGGAILITLNYEVREKLIGNIDVVMSFNHEVDLSKPLGSE